MKLQNLYSKNFDLYRTKSLMETTVTLYISYQNHQTSTRDTEAIVRGYFVKKMFIKTFQISQENNCAGVSF